MKADSPNKDISAKDIVSSIISAANRKMQKAKSRKGGGGSGSGPSAEEGKETSIDVQETADIKQVLFIIFLNVNKILRHFLVSMKMHNYLQKLCPLLLSIPNASFCSFLS